MITINNLLKNHGYNIDEVKLVRHPWNNYVANKDDFHSYEKSQIKDVYKNSKYILVFIGAEKTKAKFYKFYEVTNMCWNADEKHYIYDLKANDEFKKYENNLIIEWGTATRSWYQKASNVTKEIISLNNEVIDFIGFENIVLDYEGLQQMIIDDVKYSEWHVLLKNVYAVYLITDLNNNKHYVGSAYGEEGLFGRWKEYATYSHGHNVGMKLHEKNYDNIKYQFSILQVLSNSLMEKEVIKYEQLWKKKLGSNLNGLNEN